MIDFFMVLWCRLRHQKYWRYERVGEINFCECPKCRTAWKEPY